MGYVSCKSCGWWANYQHLKYGCCPKCGGSDLESLD